MHRKNNYLKWGKKKMTKNYKLSYKEELEKYG